MLLVVTTQQQNYTNLSVENILINISYPRPTLLYLHTMNSLSGILHNYNKAEALCYISR